MILTELQTLREQTGQSYRPLCRCVPVSYSSFIRWKGRANRGVPLLQKPGPKPVGALDLAGLRARLRALPHGRQRSRTGALYAEVRGQVSRREFGALTVAARREVLGERAAQTRRVHWKLPGLVWSIDPTEMKLPGRKLAVLPVLDLAARYQLPPLVGARLTGGRVAARLEELFAQFGAPLILKRDNGSNLNSAEVQEVLARWRVIPLNSPPQYPPYNGGIERAQRDLKAALRARLLAGDAAHPGLAALAVHDLNHRSRRSLRGHTACEMFASAKFNRRAYTARRRKECYETMRELAQAILTSGPVRTPATAWRRAVESWLIRNEIITISNPQSVTQFP